MTGTLTPFAATRNRGLFALACLCALGLVTLLGPGAPGAGAEAACPNEALRSAQGSTGLVDCRAYEQVSPPDKNGGDIASVPTRSQAATDGNAMAFASLTGFADVTGTGANAEYESIRNGTPGTNGWSTHSIIPPQEPSDYNQSVTLLPFYQGPFSGDLSTALLLTVTNLSGDPNLANTMNLYLRKDLRTPGLGSYQAIMTCAICSSPIPYFRNIFRSGPRLQGATPDFGKVIFESLVQLSPDAPEEPESCVNKGVACRPLLYEWDDGTVRYVGILPESEGGGPAIRSMAGHGPAYGGQRQIVSPISDGSDGHSRIFFGVPSGNFGSDGALYMRLDHITTVRLSASERTDCAGDPNCGGDGVPDPAPDPSGEQSAMFQIASADGTEVFFTSSEALTDNATVGLSSKLYMYDAGLPDSNPHNLTLLNTAAGLGSGDTTGVMGASRDGSHVYFLDHAGLTSGVPALDPPGSGHIYLWHAGEIRYVGTLSNSEDLDTDSLQRSFERSGSRVTPDGKHLVFLSHSGEGLTGFDHGNSCGNLNNGPCSEVYLYDASSDSLRCASCNPTGAPAAADATFTLHTQIGGTVSGSHLNHPLSSDGRYVFFTSGDKLVPEDQNSKLDVYEYDADLGKIHLLSAGTGSDDSYFLDAGADGRDVFFTTRERLLGWDRDDSVDLYDARIGGGFPEPVAAAAPCASGEECRGPASVPPPSTNPASAALSGGGNGATAKKKSKRCKRSKGTRRCRRRHSSGNRAHAGRRAR